MIYRHLSIGLLFFCVAVFGVQIVLLVHLENIGRAAAMLTQGRA